MKSFLEQGWWSSLFLVTWPRLPIRMYQRLFLLVVDWHSLCIQRLSQGTVWGPPSCYFELLSESLAAKSGPHSSSWCWYPSRSDPYSVKMRHHEKEWSMINPRRVWDCDDGGVWHLASVQGPQASPGGRHCSCHDDLRPPLLFKRWKQFQKSDEEN